MDAAPDFGVVEHAHGQASGEVQLAGRQVSHETWGPWCPSRPSQRILKACAQSARSGHPASRSMIRSSAAIASARCAAIVSARCAAIASARWS